MNVRPIKTEADYEWALKQIEPYFEHEPAFGTPDGDRFDVLITLIETYEARHYKIDDVTPKQVIEFCMEQNGYTLSDLAQILGSHLCANEILSGKREPTKTAIKKLGKHWHIPPECLSSL